ncbi:MAG: hypothetical protein ACD_40C00213G0016 [uncultured bacterium]|nr:MAG: hypothetical protein ACD_40C00213G0016 [uncultured bacterium]KKU26448.1 MAG: hypothetical protein UX37_C0002G0014 [Microgenomates group bacterium GW2011_GWA2_46_16]
MYRREVKYQGRILAIIFSHNLKSKGVSFLTPNDYTLQLGLIEHPANTVVRDHVHNPEIKYKVDTTQEFLYLEKGRVKAKIFTDDFKLVEEVILEPGDFMLHVAGGHGFEVLKKCRLIEIKQGPYPGPEHVKKYREVK